MTSVINIVLTCNVLNLTIWKTLHHTEDPLFGILLEPSAVSARDYAKRAPKSPTLRNLNFSEESPCRKWVPKLTVTSSFIDFIHLRHNSLRYTAVLHFKTSNKIYLCSRSVCRHEKSRFFVKTADWPPLLVFSGALCLVFVSICCIVLVLFYGLWLVCDVLGFSLNWLFTMIAFDKKGNAIAMQTGKRLLGWAKTNYIIAKHVRIRDELLFRSFAIVRF